MSYRAERERTVGAVVHEAELPLLQQHLEPAPDRRSHRTREKHIGRADGNVHLEAEAVVVEMEPVILGALVRVDKRIEDQ